jgi:WD40 repeat protein
VALLDLQTGQRLWTRQAPQDDPVLFVAIAPDTSAVYIAERASFGTVDGQGYQLNLLDPASGEIVATRVMEAKPRWSFAVSPHGDALLAMPFSREPGEESQRPTTMLVLDPRTLQTIRTIENITEPVHTITFAPDGKRFATCNWDGSVRLYDFNSGSRLATLSGHVDVVMAAAFSPDGRRLATAGKDRLIRIWSLETFDQVATLGGHEGHIGDLDWDATGERLLSCSGDSTVRIWEPVPVRTRVEARDARAAAVLRMQPTVDKLLTTLADTQRVIESITNNSSLNPLERRTALQLVIARGLNNAMPIAVKQPAAQRRADSNPMQQGVALEAFREKLRLAVRACNTE